MKSTEKPIRELIRDLIDGKNVDREEATNFIQEVFRDYADIAAMDLVALLTKEASENAKN